MRAALLVIVLTLAPVPLVDAETDWQRQAGSWQPRGAHLMHGRASYYDNKLVGRETASGEPYDANAMTAAHRTLPLGTMVRVTDASTRQTVTVRINDRGPYVAGRSIDLSRRAARALGITDEGVVNVTIEIVERAG